MTARNTRPRPNTRRQGASTKRRPAAQHRPRSVTRPWWRGPWALVGLVVAVIAVVVGFVVLGQSPASGPDTTPTGNQAVPATVLAAVTNPRPQVLATVGDGRVTNPLHRLPAGPVQTGADGKPLLLYIGADYCPYCAAERWSLVVALSRFGTFSNLHLMTSSSTDVFPDTNTFTFAGSSYSSPYLDFQAVETETRDRQVLQTPDATQQHLFETYDAPPYTTVAGGIPFLDLGNQLVAVSSGYSPGLLQGMTWAQIAAQFGTAASSQAQAILGNANWLTAGICQITRNQPAAVCTAAPIPGLEAQLGGSSR
jgi:hypothetical protein